MKKAWIMGASALAIAAVAFAAGPLTGHPNLIEAHTKITMAIMALERAQKGNDSDLGGHAARAEDLLHKADREIMLSGAAANHNGN